MVKTIKI